MEEIQRLFQKSNLIHADETPVSGLTIADLDLGYFKDFFHRRFSKTLDDEKLPLSKIMENMNLLKDGFLTISGALLFANTPQYKLPVPASSELWQNILILIFLMPGTETYLK
jgi:ATP-dependent DNA helicase RecG